MHLTTTFRGLVGLVLFLSTGVLHAQRITVAGTITDAAGKEPLPGVNLVVKGKVTGTTTDVRGNFSLATNTPPPFALVVSAVGYATQEVTINGDDSQLRI